MAPDVEKTVGRCRNNGGLVAGFGKARREGPNSGDEGARSSSSTARAGEVVSRRGRVGRSGAFPVVAAVLATGSWLVVPVTGAGADSVCTPIPVVELKCSEWIATYDHQGGHTSDADGEDRARAIAIAPDGSRVFVSGGSRDPATDEDFSTVALNPVTGEQLWVARHDEGLAEYATEIVVSADSNRVYVTGSHHSRRVVWSQLTVAYDASTGEELWHDLVGRGAGWDLAVSRDGTRLYVTGQEGTVAYDTATGQRLWIAEDGPQDPLGRTVGVSADGTLVYVAGGLGVAAYHAGLSEDGHLPIWAGKRVWMTQLFDVHDLHLSADGSRLYVTGGTDGGVGTAALDAASGEPLWQQTEASGLGPAVLAVSSADGHERVFTAAAVSQSPTLTSQDFRAIAYEGVSGDALWREQFDMGTHIDRFPSVATSADGERVYLVGTSSRPTGWVDYETQDPDTWTVALEAGSGDRLWLARYNGGDTSGGRVAGGRRRCCAGFRPRLHGGDSLARSGSPQRLQRYGLRFDRLLPLSSLFHPVGAPLV